MRRWLVPLSLGKNPRLTTLTAWSWTRGARKTSWGMFQLRESKKGVIKSADTNLLKSSSPKERACCSRRSCPVGSTTSTSGSWRCPRCRRWRCIPLRIWLCPWKCHSQFTRRILYRSSWWIPWWTRAQCFLKKMWMNISSTQWGHRRQSGMASQCHRPFSRSHPKNKCKGFARATPN